jgi:hypothetical protein
MGTVQRARGLECGSLPAADKSIERFDMISISAGQILLALVNYLRVANATLAAIAMRKA